MSEIAQLRIGGSGWQGWSAVSVSRSLEAAASSFSFGSTVRYPGQVDPVAITPGAACEVLLGSDSVLTGYVDAVQIAADAEGRQVAVSGRSKTGDLVDCSAIEPGGRWKNRTLTQIAADLAGPFGVSVVAEVDVGAPLPLHAVQMGETVWACIERAARLRGLLVTDDAAGRLVLTRGGAVSDLGAALTSPGNVLRSSVSLDASQRFSIYTCRGQLAGDDQAWGETVAGPWGDAADDQIVRYRPLLVMAEASADIARARTRATWEAATRAGRSIAYEATVAGWRTSEGGDLWRVGSVVSVEDGPLGVSADLILVELTHTQDEGGTMTTLRLAPPGGFDLLAPAERRRRGKKKINKGIGGWAELSEGVR